MVDKIIAYESASGAWAGRALALADDPDAGGAFETNSDAVASVLAARFSVTNVYLGRLGLAATRLRTLQAWNEGVGCVNYAGHGAIDRLAQEGILVAADVAALTNGCRAPLLVSMTCVVGRYSVPGFPCLGEELMRSGGGAIAVISPVGLSSEQISTPLNLALARRLALGPTRLGDLWISSVSDYLDAGRDPVAPVLFNVLGDPGVKLK